MAIEKKKPQRRGCGSEQQKTGLFALGGFPFVFADESGQIAAVAGFGSESIAFLSAFAVGLEFGDFSFDFLAVLHVIKIVFHGILHVLGFYHTHLE